MDVYGNWSTFSNISARAPSPDPHMTPIFGRTFVRSRKNLAIVLSVSYVYLKRGKFYFIKTDVQWDNASILVARKVIVSTVPRGK